MNYRLLARLLGLISLLIGGTMIFSMPWAMPGIGFRTGETVDTFESAGFVGLLGSIFVCGIVGGVLIRLGRGDKGQFYRKEAMAVVGLSWVLATVLGALPFYFTGVGRGSSVRLFGPDEKPRIALVGYQNWRTVDHLTTESYAGIESLVNAGAVGLSEEELVASTNDPHIIERLDRLRKSDEIWKQLIIKPGRGSGPEDRAHHYRVLYLKMTIVDCLFESQSGFSTTGATVISDLEDPEIVPHCILFWRSSMHFLGGLGIVVLFVVILGQGSIGKAMMRAEMPGPTKEGSTARMQHTAWMVAGMYIAMNVILAVILWFLGMSSFDALCHTFGTMATGGFSTYNASLGHFDSPAIEYVVTLFMFLAGCNFVLLFLSLTKPWNLVADVEWRVYLAIILISTVLLICYGLWFGDFDSRSNAIRYSLFQVVSIITTTGFGTHDFDVWNHFGRGVLLLLMFVGGCAGSTGGGLKVIRVILFAKVLRMEIEHAFHPNVIRPLRLGGKPVDDPELGKNILVYVGLIATIFVGSWLFIIMFEPDTTWGRSADHKLIDTGSAIAATLNNIGPGLGAIGPTQNYGHFSEISKFLFVWLMMLGRLELF
ncbi:MAG: trk system potassium uptake protein TrkH, partial [Pirellulaceae bacterium]